MGRFDAEQYAIDMAQRIGMGNAAAPTVEERRAHARIAYNKEIHTVWAAHSTASPRRAVMRASDLSPSGVCLLSRLVLPRGTKGAALLIRPDESTVHVGLEVMHLGYAGGMLNACGCRFIAAPEPLRDMLMGRDRGGQASSDERAE